MSCPELVIEEEFILQRVSRIWSPVNGRRGQEYVARGGAFERPRIYRTNVPMIDAWASQGTATRYISHVPQ